MIPRESLLAGPSVAGGEVSAEREPDGTNSAEGSGFTEEGVIEAEPTPGVTPATRPMRSRSQPTWLKDYVT